MIDFQSRPVFAPSAFEFLGALPILLPDRSLLNQGVATIGTIEYSETYPVSLYAASGAEQVLAVHVDGQDIVLIMGCGHPTVERIVARAETLVEQPVIGIVGGLPDEGKSAKDVQPHIEFLQARNLIFIALSPHDSSPDALQAFRSAFPEQYREIEVGLPLTLQSKDDITLE